MTEDQPTTTETSAPDWVKPPLPLEEQLLAAQLVVKGTISSDAAEGATLEVDEILLSQADDEPGSPLLVAHGPGTTEGRSGIWLLGPGDPHQVLVDPSDAKEAEVRRIMAGRSRLPDPPTVEAVRALAADSDRVVFARMTATGPAEAEAEVEEPIRGEGPQGFSVSRGPGADWAFPTGAPSYGVLFLQRDGDRWLVLNDQEPGRYQYTAVTEALG
ncbi:MAG: hypothetical protein JWM47_2105 [Acidimicrobiales bacterium]|nr:hypothetical protein [Acidimicrobiales bacterium]